MDKAIIGRDKELQELQEIYESDEPQFLAVYGRRRIGKTYLISEFFKNKGVYFEITGMKEGGLRPSNFSNLPMNFHVNLMKENGFLLQKTGRKL